MLSRGSNPIPSTSSIVHIIPPGCVVCDFCFVGVDYGIPQIMMKGRVSNVQVVSKYMDKCCINDFVKE